jgi:hypothetical protein
MATSPAEIEAVQADVRRIAVSHTGAVVFAMFEVLIDVACGDNPYLRDYKRLQIWRGVRNKLLQRGLK